MNEYFKKQIHHAKNSKNFDAIMRQCLKDLDFTHLDTVKNYSIFMCIVLRFINRDKELVDEICKFIEEVEAVDILENVALLQKEVGDKLIYATRNRSL